MSFTRFHLYLYLISKLNLQVHVILKTDFIPDAEVKNYFSAADLVVQPYRHATQSGVTQIAYQFNKPMIVTNVGGLPNWCRMRKWVMLLNPIRNLLPKRSLVSIKTKKKFSFVKIF